MTSGSSASRNSATFAAASVRGPPVNETPATGTSENCHPARWGEHAAESAARLINWMNGRGLALLALNWSRELPPEMLGSLTLRFALADSYVQARDWPALTAMLKRGSWQGVESFKRALQAKVARVTGDYDTWEKEWA